MEHLDPQSRILYAGREESCPAPEAMPLYMTTAYTMDDLEQLQRVDAAGGHTYIRKSNPNRTALAHAISDLEGGGDSLIFASGMAAITTTFLALLSPGDHVVCNASIYGESYETLTILMPKLGVTTDFVDFQDVDALAAAMRLNTRLVHTEVVSNPTMALTDIAAVARIAHSVGALCMVDNTFTTPVLVRPLDLGADLVMNSLTKFLCGHSDVMAGSITGAKGLIDAVQYMSMLCGTPADPHSAWLVHRSLATAHMRITRQAENAAALARALEQDPRVIGVNHPGLTCHPQHGLARRLLGGCPMLSVLLPEDMDRLNAFLRALRLAKYAPTLGGVRTTLSHPVTSSHQNVPDATRRTMGITPGMLRISVGCEGAADLIADFSEALGVFD